MQGVHPRSSRPDLRPEWHPLPAALRGPRWSRPRMGGLRNGVQEKMLPRHRTPEECLTHLAFERNTAGREEFLKDHGIEFEATQTRVPGDCAVIAIALAREETYCFARDLLKARWRRHHPKERIHAPRGVPIAGRIAGYLHQRQSNDHDPLWGTPGIVYGNTLELPYSFTQPVMTLFDMVYGEHLGHPATCLCDPTRAFVIDGYMGRIEESQHHVTAILQGTIAGDFDIRERGFEVVHVWRSNQKSPSLDGRKELGRCTIHRPFPLTE